MRKIFFALMIVPVLCGIVSAQDKPLKALSSADFAERFRSDTILFRSYANNLSKTMTIIEGNPVVFNRARTRDFDLAEREQLYTVWTSYIDHMVAFESLTDYYKKFYLITNRQRHARAFLIAYAAYVTKLANGFRFIDRTIDNALYEKKLDDPNPALGMPGGLYARLKWNTIHAQEVSSLFAGYQYYQALMPYYRKHGLTEAEETGWIFGHVDENYRFVTALLKTKAPELFTKNGLDILREKSFGAWFPLQRDVSQFMGQTRVKRGQRYLITNEQLARMNIELRPGDIIVERRNWYLSNVGLPGFWPHAEIYIGSLEEMRRFFDDPEVKRYYRSQGRHTGFVEYLKQRFPEKMQQFAAKDHEGHAYRIIEAVGEGVKFSSLEEGAGADYIGVMRPRLSKLDIAGAIEEAFAYLGRPYDFNFDFLTDNSIVCSELIYKIYKNGKRKRGIDFRLRDVAGRKAMPANDIVEKFDREFNAPGQELDFVYFLDGNEQRQEAVVNGIAAFRLSHKRPKWDIAQQ